jgi:hypothetical protein
MMREWFNTQKKPNRDLRKLLQKRIDKAGPTREILTKEAQHKLAKLLKKYWVH